MTRTVIVWLLASGVALAAGEAGAGPLDGSMPCRTAVRTLLDRWQVTDEAFQEVGVAGVDVWRLPTRRLGRWAVLARDADGRPTLARIDAAGEVRFRFSGACDATDTARPSATHLAPVGAMTDDVLSSLIERTGAGVIYIWSPHLPLSVDAYPHVAAAAETLGLALTALLDPAASVDYARDVGAAAGLPASSLRSFDSVELLFRNATLHAPTMVVYANGRIRGLAIPGYRDADGYRRAIETRLRPVEAAATVGP